uniref:Uncharacterized protein n=1 Tax=Hyaloperonospora arabidopsidis (strain Emoy2) TaxID=559515 RepID=M4BU41_HYAAE
MQSNNKYAVSIWIAVVVRRPLYYASWKTNNFTRYITSPLGVYLNARWLNKETATKVERSSDEIIMLGLSRMLHRKLRRHHRRSWLSSAELDCCGSKLWSSPFDISNPVRRTEASCKTLYNSSSH